MAEPKTETIETYMDNDGKVVPGEQGTWMIRAKIVDGVVTERSYFYTKEYVPKAAEPEE